MARVKNIAYFRFYEKLNDFLITEKRQTLVNYTFTNHPSIKDAIEAIGVPHTEVDFILVNQQSVDFNYQLYHRDYCSLYPTFESIDISGSNNLYKSSLHKIKFIMDVHLGKLTRYLRLLGFDSYYQNNLDDATIIKIAIKEERIVLTRDIGLLKNTVLTHGFWLRNTQPELQLREILNRLDLKQRIKPFSRCLECNGVINYVSRKSIIEKIPEKIASDFNEFYQCSDCHRVYWKGSHYDKMLSFIQQEYL